MTTSVSPLEAVASLSAALGESHTLIGPLTGGETGATEIRDPRGERRVLKWEADPIARVQRTEGVVFAERLRTEADWPVPQQQVVEHDDLTFVLQEFMAGDPVVELSAPLVDHLLTLHERRLGLARAGDPNRWADQLVETLVDGGRGFCLHEPLRTYDHRTRRIVERIEELGRSLDRADLGGDDVVHFDLHAGNLLHTNGRLSAIVDLDFALVGDAGFDLATLAVSSLESPERAVSDHLFETVDTLDPRRRQAYLAHLVLRILDWPIRKGRTADVEFWLGQADRLLPED